MATFKSSSDWARNQKKKFSKCHERSFRIAANTAHADQVKRIFEEGKNSSDKKMGTYKSASYKRLRAKRGRETGFVNLRFTGKLQLDYSNGATPETKEINEVQRVAGVKSERNAVKIDDNEKRYGKIFDLTKGERAVFVDTLQTELILCMNA